MSYTLNYTGSEIDDILDRAAPGGAIDQALAAKQDVLTFDAVPTEGSTNPAESGGIYDSIQAGGAAALAAFATDSVSGDVVSFPDGADGIPVKSFTGSIIPSQNLNGQASPWPAGATRNKLDIGSSLHDWFRTSQNGTRIDNTETSIDTLATGTVNPYTGAITITSYNSSGYRWASKEVFLEPNTNYKILVSGFKVVGFSSLAPGTGTYEHIIITFYPVSFSRTEVMILLDTESDTSFIPYSNICPISGWTGAEIIRAGVNLYDDSTTSVGSYINASGVVGTSSGNVFSLSDYIRIGGDKVTITNTGGWGTAPSVCFFDKDKNFISGTHPTTSPVTLTIPSGAAYLRTSLSTQTRASAQVELGETASTFEPYDGEVITLNFGQTVYAGTLTALGGGLWKIQPTHAIKDLGDYEYTLNANFGFRATVTGGITPVAGGDAGSICSAYKRISFPTVADPSLMTDGDYTIAEANISPVINYVYFKNSAYSTAAAFKTAMAGQKLVYTLAPESRPDPITITGEDLQTLLGANTVWLDCGAVTGMTYRADTALYIQKLIGGGGTLQTLSMASPSPSLSLGRVGVLAEPEVSEPEQTDEEAEQLEQTEEPEQTEEA